MLPAIEFENIGKRYSLGMVSTRTLSHDLRRWWEVSVRGRGDPYGKIGMGGKDGMDGMDGKKGKKGKKGKGDGYIWALRDINLSVAPGEVLGIIGKNGAGKSTLLKILSKVTAPTTGIIRARGRIASLLEVGTGFHPEMTGRENIFMNGAIMGMTRAEIRRKFDEIVAFAGVEPHIDTPVKRYSSGMTVRLGFAVAAHLEPEILVVDEVLAVGDAEFQKKAVGKMQEVSRGEGRTVLFVSHNMATIRSICSNAIILQNGLVVQQGPVDEMIPAYLAEGRKVTGSEEIGNLRRTGNKKVIFSNFHVETIGKEPTTDLLTGEDYYFVFTLKCNEKNLKNIDLGFSLHNAYDELITVLYSSYNGIMGATTNEDIIQIKCLIENLNIAPGILRVKGRIEVNGDEADWPTDPLGQINIIMGDFYRTGQIGFQGSGSEILLSGKWSS